NVFAVADHTKAAIFILSEGVVPSNVHEGYLIRLLIRRTSRLLKTLGIEDSFQDIVEMQIAQWAPEFPNLELMREEILRLLNVEQEKYRRNLERGQQLVRRLATDLKASGQAKMPADILIEMYDSQGLAPDVVSDVATKEGIQVEIPHDFYSLVVGKKTERPIATKTHLQTIIEEKATSLPATRLLYYDDSYRREFRAKVVATFDNNSFILDQTCFYAEGGGQPGDHGKIRSGSEEWDVIDTQKIGNIIVHVTGKGVPQVGAMIDGEIQWSRRIALMRHHSAAHVLMGAVRRVLGAHAWQTGAQKDIDKARLDISHYQKLTEEETLKIEKLSNEVVLSGIPIDTQWMPREKAEQAYGFRLYQGGVVPGREIRIVKTGDWEVEACGGTHCKNTGEIGLIKIVRTDRIQDGVERLTFVAGLPAVDLVQEQHKSLTQIEELTASPVDQLAKTIQELLEQNRALRQQVDALRGKSLEAEAETMLSNAREISHLRLIVSKRGEESEEDLMKLAQTIAKLDDIAVSILLAGKTRVQIFVSAGKKAIEAGVDAGRIARELALIVGGGGGGKPYFGQGGGTSIEKIDQALKETEQVVTKSLK
ncbi:MAG: alanine--tRNA ligase, partial [archaeon]